MFSGRGTFWMEDAASIAEFGPGQLLYFRRGIVHALPDMIEKATALHRDAHEKCFIASSVDFPVRHEPVVAAARPG